MEVLVAVLAALAVLLIPIAVLLAAAAVLGASGVVEVATAAKRRTSEIAKPSAAPARSVVARVALWIAVVSGALAVGSMLLLLALNTVAFEWAVRQALAAGQTKSGIAADFESADGNLFVGRVNLTNATFVRRGHPVSDFDLQVDKLDLDADVWKLLAGQTVFEQVKVDGVRGDFTRNGQRDPLMPRRQFAIDSLTVENVSLSVADQSRPPREVSVPLEVKSLEIADFRSTWAAFDMLFRSTCQGLLDGQPFSIVNRPVEGGEAHETQWVARDLPVYVLSGYFAGPLSWLVDGRLDVDVTTRWRPDDNDPELEMHCHLVAHGFAADVPEQLKALQKVFEPALAALNDSNARLPIEFDATMSKEAFRGQLSPLAAGLAEVLAQASGKAFTKLFPTVAGRIGERVDRIRSTIRGLLRPREGDALESEEEVVEGEGGADREED
ncbi:MAG: hypothetical protein AB7G28_11400 [Pirellulales bacterium]